MKLSLILYTIVILVLLLGCSNASTKNEQVTRLDQNTITLAKIANRFGEVSLFNSEIAIIKGDNFNDIEGKVYLENTDNRINVVSDARIGFNVTSNNQNSLKNRYTSYSSEWCNRN